MSPCELEGLNQRKHAAGRPTRHLSRGRLLSAILFHYTISLSGTFGSHLAILFGTKMAESSLSERRQALPLEVFQELLRRMLRPIQKMRDPEQACYRDWKLVAVDGISFSLPNTESVKRKMRKGGNQHGRNAFAKLQCAVLLELVMHNPLAAALGARGESEWKLAQELLEAVPEKCLLLADRLYGYPAFVSSLITKLASRGSHFLLRVKSQLRSLLVRKLKDGSQVIEIEVKQAGQVQRIQVREIRATVKRRGFRAVRVRLWTSLLDPVQAPAKELVELYMKRWEQELYFRELKQGLGVNDLLRSQTVETAVQEVAAMIIGSSLVAHERAKLKPGQALQHRVSFVKTWQTLEPLWLTLLLGADLLTDEQKQQLCERFYALAAQQLMPKKRVRSCPRAVRQPYQRWPQRKRQRSSTEPLNIFIRRPS